MVAAGKVTAVAAAWPRVPRRVRILLALVEANAAGRAYAAYGGHLHHASLCWLWLVEGVRPDRWDLAGASLCLAGASVILLAPRGA